MAGDIRYILAHWPGLIRFLNDGTLELDTNLVENQIRLTALTRKDGFFAGNEIGAEIWATPASPVATCTTPDVHPVDYIAATLHAIRGGHPHNRIEELRPWRFGQQSSLTAHGVDVVLAAQQFIVFGADASGVSSAAGILRGLAGKPTEPVGCDDRKRKKITQNQWDKRCSGQANDIRAIRVDNRATHN